MRNILVFLVTVAFFFSSLSIPAVHAESVQPGDFSYEIQPDGTISITGYSGASTVVVIPDKIDDQQVTQIGDSAFYNKQLTSVTIPESVTTIGTSAFAYNQLTSIAIPSHVTDIFGGAFQHNQLTSVMLPQGITRIAQNTFANNLLTSITIPSSVTTIEQFSFSYNNLTRIEMPGATFVGRGAFEYNQLKNVNLPKVTTLEAYAFAYNQLEEITLSDNLQAIGDYAFYQNRLTRLANLPDHLVSIGLSAFANNTITSVWLPASVQEIRTGAFNSNLLGDFALPPGVKIGDDSSNPVFAGNPNLKLYSSHFGISAQDYAQKYNTYINFRRCEYTITYDGNGSTGTLPSSTAYVCYKQTYPTTPLSDPGTLTKTGYTFKGWNTKADGSGTNYDSGSYPVIYGYEYPSLTFYANWEINRYRVTFNAGSSPQIPDQIIDYGAHVNVPSAPTRTGYSFEGWYQDSGYTQPWDFANDTVTADTALYAKWQWNGQVTIASVQFTWVGLNVTGGDTVSVTGVVKDTNGDPVANAVVNIESWQGKWYGNRVGRVSAATDANGVFSADWTAPWAVNPQSATFAATVEGADITPANLSIPIVPSVKSDVKLSGISVGAGALDPAFSADTLSYSVSVGNVMKNLDVTITAENPKATLIVNGYPAHSGQAVNVPLSKGSNTIPILIAAEDGINSRLYMLTIDRAFSATSGDYVYDLNDQDNTVTIIGYKGPAGDIVIPDTLDGRTVTAVAGFNDKQLTGVTIPGSVTAIQDSAFARNKLERVTFSGSGLKTIGMNAFTDNLLTEIVLPRTLTAIDYGAFYGNPLTTVMLPANVTMGTQIFAGNPNPSAPTLTLISPTDNDLTSGTDSYAMANHYNWKASAFRVRYDGNGQSNGESPVDSKTYDFYQDVTILLPGTLTKDGYTFKGWNDRPDGNGNAFAAGSTRSSLSVDTDVTLYATWEPIVQYSVSFETSGGTAITGVTVNAGDKLVEPPAPQKSGYRFAGWYKEAGWATAWDFAKDTVTGNVTLYAKWEEEQALPSAPDSIRLTVGNPEVMSGQTITVTGVVYDGNGSPLVQADVDLGSTAGGQWDKTSVTTDGNGEFTANWTAPIVTSIVTGTLSASVRASDAAPAIVGIQVLPEQGRSSNAQLSGLTLSDGELTPQFSAARTDYTANVGNATDAVSIAVQLADSSATAVINGNPAKFGQPTAVILSEGSNMVTIIVTAQDGTTKKYTITITRASAHLAPVPVTSVAVTGLTYSVYEGSTLQLHATVSPDNATNKQVVWSVEPGTGEASISQTGVVTGIKAGTVTIVATALDGSGAAGRKSITIDAKNGGDDGAGGTPTPPTPAPPPSVPVTPAPITPPTPPTPPAPVPTVKDVVPGKPVFDANDLASVQWMKQVLSDKIQNAQQPNVPAFQDAEKHWAADSIKLFTKLGIVRGYEDNTFKPDKAITRGEFAVMITKLFPLSRGSDTADFSDLANGWAKEAVQTLASNGILSGYEDGTFRADRRITREEMVAILARIVNLNQEQRTGTANFQDIDHSWAKDQIEQASKAGIISGKRADKFAPEAGATRAEALAVLERTLRLNPEIEQLLKSI